MIMVTEIDVDQAVLVRPVGPGWTTGYGLDIARENTMLVGELA